MQTMKRTFLLLMLCCALLVPCSCTAPRRGDAPQVVCTAFAAYDFVRNLTAGTPIETTLLSDDGADPHSFQPTARDLITIHCADLFVYLGGESEQWAVDAAAAAERDEGVTTLCLADAACLRDEQDHNHDHGHGDEHDHADADEHYLMSVANARAVCARLTEALCALAPETTGQLHENLTAYDAQLAALEADLHAMRAEAQYDALLVADRFPFLYLTEDLSLTVCAAFPGCSAETEASFATVTRLTDFLTEHRLPAVIVTEASDARLAHTVMAGAERELPVLVLDSLQSTTKQQLAAGETYLTRMRRNVDILRKALNDPM